MQDTIGEELAAGARDLIQNIIELEEILFLPHGKTVTRMLRNAVVKL